MTHRFLISSLIFCIITLSSISSHANVMVTPFRITFEDRTRSQIVTVINRSDKRATFRIEWINTIANEDSSYTTLEEGDSRLDTINRADKIIRFSPRQVTLAPGDKQAIRVAIRKPSDLEEGEYRSHLLFKQLAEAHEQENSLPGLSLSLNLSVSIPVIVRHGKLETDAVFEKIEFNKSYSSEKEDEFIATLSRIGKASTYGSIKVFDANDKKQENILAVLNNVSIFAENNTKVVKIPIFEDIPKNIRTLKFVYEGKNEYDSVIFDEFIYERP